MSCVIVRKIIKAHQLLQLSEYAHIRKLSFSTNGKYYYKLEVWHLYTWGR
jgi:hypothetical protein